MAEVLGLAEVGCEIVRITAQTKVYAANLATHRTRGLRAAGCQVPLVADIHFKPDAALEAAKWVEKVRVNPGNYADKKKFEIREYTDAQYEEELDRIRERVHAAGAACARSSAAPCASAPTTGRSRDRIMNRYGDTPLGMVESALGIRPHRPRSRLSRAGLLDEGLQPEGHDRGLSPARRPLDAQGPDWNYPIHLGVTEAGDGEDGRIKSAIGIGSLLADGIGDTIRVSLTEDSVHEIPVARALAEWLQRRRRSPRNPAMIAARVRAFTPLRSVFLRETS